MGTVAGVAATVRRQCGAARGGLEDCQPLAARNERHQAACTALRAFARSIDDVALRSRWPPIPSHRQAVIVALRRAQRPVWAPGVRILGRPPIIRRRSRTSSIVDRAPIAWVRWGGPTDAHAEAEAAGLDPEQWTGGEFNFDDWLTDSILTGRVERVDGDDTD